MLQPLTQPFNGPAEGVIELQVTLVALVWSQNKGWASVSAVVSLPYSCIAETMNCIRRGEGAQVMEQAGYIPDLYRPPLQECMTPGGKSKAVN